MSTTDRECVCGKPTRDQATLCDDCRQQLERALGDVSWLDEELETTITKQRGAGGHGGAPSAERPLPWHERASVARRELHDLLVWWVRFCTEERVRGLADWQPDNRLVSLARWMLHATRGLSYHDDAADALDQITDAVAECERIIFWKRRSRMYLGKCEQVVRDEDDNVIVACCPGEVYADEGDAVGACEECSQGVTVVIRKAEIDQRLEAHLLTAAEAAEAATYLDLGVERERIRKRINQWHARGRIIPARSEDDVPRFRWRDLRILLYAEYGRDTTAGSLPLSG